MICSLNSFKRLKFLGSLPIIRQFFPVLQAPLLDNRCRLSGQLSPHEFPYLDTHLCNEALILDMHMRRGMVVVPHAKDHAKKDGKNGHVDQAPYCLPTQCL
jgi:hypothetical protein